MQYIKEFENEELKKYAREMGRLKIRIVEIKLENGTVEYLATNLDMEEFSFKELKELYGKRWSIETGFKKLKSQIQIENFSGYRRIIIEQDFHANIFLYNLATAIQWDANRQLAEKQKDLSSDFVYKSCFSSIVGIMYVYLEDILSADSKRVSESINFLIQQAKRLYHEKNLVRIEFEKFLNNMKDLFLQGILGSDWEKYKNSRSANDPTNDHPGNPKPTH